MMTQFLASDVLPNVMQNFGIALLTLLIPLVIFLLEDKSSLPWDHILILEKVIDAKWFSVSVLLIFIPVFFWHLEQWRSWLFLAFIMGVILFIDRLLVSYYWLRAKPIGSKKDSNNFRDKIREEYLGSNDGWSEKEKIWEQTWRNKIGSNVEERKFIKIFLRNVDVIISENNSNFVVRYLRIFSETLENRALYDVVIFDDILEKLLDWYFIYYEKRIGWDNETNKNKITIAETQDTLFQLINKFVVSAFQKGNAYYLLDRLKRHVVSKDTIYIKSLFINSICQPFFDNVADSNEKDFIWGNALGENLFLNEWKVTKETYQDENNIVSKIWLDQFIRWALPRFRQYQDKDFDKNLDEVSSSLFPTVNPMLWAEILTLLMRPYGTGSRMQSLIEQGTNFGHVGRIITRDYKSDEDTIEVMRQQRSIEEENTMELALNLFSKDFSKEKLQSYVNELKNLKYTEDSREEYKRRHFIEIFQKMILISDKNN